MLTIYHLFTPSLFVVSSLRPCLHKARVGPCIFWRSTAWKRGMITGIKMLPRADMFKPEDPGLSMRAAFTDTQEMKQVPCFKVKYLTTKWLSRKH